MSNTLPPNALKPVVSVGKSTTVMEAIEAMTDQKVGAVVVLDDQRLVGVFTERDVLLRVVLEKRDPETTVVAVISTVRVPSKKSLEKGLTVKKTFVRPDSMVRGPKKPIKPVRDVLKSTLSGKESG